MTPDTSAAFFESMYAANADPWAFASSEYELGRYCAILAALGGRHYRRAFEPGCSIGVLTQGLAGVCDQVEAMDLSPSAIEQARERCRHLENVHLTCGSLADATLQGGFDLIVLSEIGYYFEEARLRGIVSRLLTSLQPGGLLLAAHWLGSSPDHILSGDRVHEIICDTSWLRIVKAERHDRFRLDLWERL